MLNKNYMENLKNHRSKGCPYELAGREDYGADPVTALKIFNLFS